MGPGPGVNKLLPLAFPRSAGGPDPGSFQITASPLCPGTCDVLCGPFKSGIFVFHSPLALPRMSCWSSKANVLGAHSSSGSLHWGAQCGGQTPRSLGSTSATVFIFPFVGHPPSVGLNFTASPPLLPTLLWFLLYIFSCRRSSLLESQSFSSIFAL